MNDLARRRVIVTGADGFIGSHLVERLVREGAEVTAFCMYNSMGSLGWLDHVDVEVQRSIRPVLGDIRDAEFVAATLADADIVFHLAALIAIPYSYVAPRSFVETNVGGTLNVLEASRNGSVGRLVHTSTSEVYGTPDTVPIVESHALKGQSPYSASKIAADKLAESYALSFETPVTTLRPFNTYGPRQSARAVITTILLQLLSGVTEVRLGALHPRRDFTFVADTVEGFVRAATADVGPGTTVHLGTGHAVSIGELFQICRDMVGSRATVVTDEERVRPEGSEVQILQSDPRRASEVLGWRPDTSLEDGVRATAEWLRGTDGSRWATSFQL